MSTNARSGHSRRSFHAFVSYSRAADGKLAPALQRGLQRFAKPWYRLRALRIFRDDASLSANPDLWGSIQQALDDSEFFILLASPESAGSQWVAKEAEYWLERRGADRILIVLTGGELGWRPGQGVDPERTTALPPPLRDAFAEEPRYVDMSWARREEQLAPRDARFRSALADLAAPLHGRSKDEMLGEDVRQHRRTLTIAWTAAALLALLAAAAGAAAIFAVQARDRARTQARIALSRQLAVQSVSRLTGPLELAPLLGLEAFRLVHDRPTTESFDARNAMLSSLERSPRLVATLPQVGVHAIAFSPDGRTLVSAGEHGRVRIWRAVDGASLGPPSVDGGGTVTAIAFSGDGKVVATGSTDGTIRFWDARNARPLSRPLRREGERAGLESTVNAIAFSPGDALLASGGFDGRIELWDVRRRREVAELGSHDSEVLRVAFGSGGRRLISIDGSATTKLWAVGPRALLRTIAHRPGGTDFRPVGFSQDGTEFASMFDGLQVWDARSHKLPGAALPGQFGISTAAFGPNRRMLAAAGVGAIELVDTRTRRRIAALPLGPDDEIASMSIDPTGRILASANADGTVRLWDLRPDEPLGRTLAPGGGPGARTDVVGAVAFSPDGRTLASTGAFTGLTFWDLGLGRAPDVRGRTPFGVEAIAFSPDGADLAIGGGHGKVALVPRLRSGLRSLYAGQRAVWSLAFDPAGDSIVIGHDDGSFETLDVRSGRLLSRVHLDLPPTCRTTGIVEGKYANCFERVAFSPDRRTAAVFGGTGQIRLWDVVGRDPLGQLRAEKFQVSAVAFSPDGRTLVSGGSEVRLWDLTRELPLGRPLPGDSRVGVDSVVFSPDGTHLASGSGNGTVRVWDPILLSTSYEAWWERLCRIAGRNLTEQEWSRFVGTQPYHRTCPEYG